MLPKTKICGITRVEDALLAESLGAYAVGFIFYPKSERYIKPADAKRISDALGPFTSRVGVFVNENPGIIMSTVKQAGLSAVQLHGLERPETIKIMNEIPVIKAIRIKDDFDPAELTKYDVSAYLLDAYDPKSYGGTGTTFDWSHAVSAKKIGRIILAGGLNADNICKAIDTVHPWGIDLSSSLESKPGIKDHEKMQAFFKVLYEKCANEMNNI